MVYAGAAWTAGLALAAVSGSVCAASAVILSAFLIFKFIFGFNIKSVIFMTAVFISAFGFYRTYDTLIYGSIVKYAGKEIQYTGTVTDFKDFSGNKSAYYLTGKINGKTKAEIILYNDSLMCEPGDKLSFSCTANIPENEYLFSGLDYYKSKGIYLRTDSAGNINIKISVSSIRKTFYKFRENVCSAIDKAAAFEESGMIKGMLFGDKSGIDEDNLTMLYRTGIGHTTAVSGLHLVLFCALISFIMKKFNAGKIVEFTVSEIFMLLFMMCCGMSVSVIRAFIMMSLVNLAPLFFRYNDSLNSICIAVILLTLPNPFVIANQSFLLSVSGAVGAGVFAPYMTSNIKADNSLRKQLKNFLFLLCISVSVMPASIICFGEVSLVSPISNLIITPLCMAAILTAMTASLLIFINPVFLFKISGALCRIVLNISKIIGRNKFTHINLSGKYISVISFILIVFCISTYLIFRNRTYNILSIAISAAVLFGSASFYNIAGSQTLKIAVLGKNEPGVIVISKGLHADIIDINGKAKNSRYTAKYLNDSGISKINSIILTSKPSSAMSSYNYELSLFDADNVILPSGTYLRENTYICGCLPKYSDLSEWSAEYSDYSVSVKENIAYTDYGNFHFSYPEKESNNTKYPSNIVIYVSDNGKYEFRRL